MAEMPKFEVTIRIGALVPLMCHLYQEAGLKLPEKFNPDTEGPRLVAALRAQGFATQFKEVDS